MFCDVFSFPPGVYIGTLNLIASIPGPSVLILHVIFLRVGRYGAGQNLAVSSGSTTWPSMIHLWDDEKYNFTYGSGPVGGAVVGHYTQVRCKTFMDITKRNGRPNII